MTALEAKKVLRFPAQRTAHAARGGASRADVAKFRLLEWIGKLAGRLALPGAIQETQIHDPLTGQRITVTVGALMVRLTVNGRDFYFDRFTGRFDGTGSDNS